jgi:hypothetical protein
MGEVDLCLTAGRLLDAHLGRRRRARPNVAQESGQNAVAAGVAAFAARSADVARSAAETPQAPSGDSARTARSCSPAVGAGHTSAAPGPARDVPSCGRAPTCRAIADTLTPWRCNSRVIAISPIPARNSAAAAPCSVSGPPLAASCKALCNPWPGRSYARPIPRLPSPRPETPLVGAPRAAHRGGPCTLRNQD